MIAATLADGGRGSIPAGGGCVGELANVPTSAEDFRRKSGSKMSSSLFAPPLPSEIRSAIAGGSYIKNIN